MNRKIATPTAALAAAVFTFFPEVGTFFENRSGFPVQPTESALGKYLEAPASPVLLLRITGVSAAFAAEPAMEGSCRVALAAVAGVFSRARLIAEARCRNRSRPDCRSVARPRVHPKRHLRMLERLESACQPDSATRAAEACEGLSTACRPTPGLSIPEEPAERLLDCVSCIGAESVAPVAEGLMGNFTGTERRCGGCDGAGCGPDGFCEQPDGLCADFTVSLGICVEPGAEVPCGDAGRPVCGCDGVTYPGDCQRRKARVSKRSDGPCQEAPRRCGGAANGPCLTGSVCDSSCQDGGLAGICVSRPDACPEIYQPVCGCDGVTYANDCERLRAGAAYRYDGECGSPAHCGGFTGIACNSGQFCDLEPGRCGLSDRSGLCIDRPAVCPDHVQPVCGCDGVTYGNECERRAVGVSLAHVGPCPTRPPSYH